MAEISDIIKEYDEKIPFPLYAGRVLARVRDLPDITTDFSILCPLHEENTPSFKYSSGRGLWTCFGACNTSGKTVKFHKLYLEKELGYEVSYMYVLKDLYKLFKDIVQEPKITSTYNDNKDFVKSISILSQYAQEEKQEINVKNKFDDINLMMLQEFLSGYSYNTSD